MLTPPILPVRGIQGAKNSAEAILAALEACDGQQSRAWQVLGLSSRRVLKRLIKKHGIEVER